MTDLITTKFTSEIQFNLDAFGQEILAGSTLEELSHLTNESLEKTYLYASRYCQEIFGEHIKVISPALYEDRHDINQLNKNRIELVNNRRRLTSKLQEVYEETSVILSDFKDSEDE